MHLTHAFASKVFAPCIDTGLNNLAKVCMQLPCFFFKVYLDISLPAYPVGVPPALCITIAEPEERKMLLLYYMDSFR